MQHDPSEPAAPRWRRPGAARHVGGALAAGVRWLIDLVWRDRVAPDALADAVREQVALTRQVARLTQELRDAQTLQRAQWSAVAHDSNNMLAATQAVVDDVLIDMAELGVPDERRALIERRVVTSLRGIGQLIDDMHTATLLDQGALTLDLQPTDLAAVIAAVIAQLDVTAEQYGCQLQVQGADAPLRVTADAWRLERALAHLVSAALQDTRRVRGRARRVTVRAGRRAQGVEVQVVDTGVGADADALGARARAGDRLAAAYAAHGRGAGGYLSRGIIERHGGTLAYESAGPGHGTTATVWLPDSQPPREETGCNTEH